MDKMIALSGLTKKFGPILAVDDVNLSVQRGDVLGFLGPNGAGKTTTMRMVTGFLTPTEGTVEVCGFDVLRSPLEAKQKIGYLPEGAPLYDDMTPAAFLDFIADIRGFGGADKARRVDDAVAKVELDTVLHRPIATLSKGYKRRVGLAQAILHDPEVLILDEPTDGLDPNQKAQVRNLISGMAENKAIVISTHLLEEVEAVCSRAVIIANGRVVFDGTPVELESKSAHFNAVSIRMAESLAPKVREELESLSGVKSIENVAQSNGVATLRVTPQPGKSILRDLSERIRASGLEIDEIQAERGDLNEVFRDLTAGA